VTGTHVSVATTLCANVFLSLAESCGVDLSNIFCCWFTRAQESLLVISRKMLETCASMAFPDFQRPVE